MSFLSLLGNSLESREYWNRREAYKLHIYATIVRALTYKKYVEMEEAQQKQEQKAQEGKEQG